MGLYPRHRPRGTADAARATALAERRSAYQHYSHDTRSSPVRSTRYSGRGAEGSAETGTTTGPTTSGPSAEFIRLAAASSSHLYILRVREDGTVDGLDANPIALPAAARSRNVTGMAYEGGSSRWLRILDNNNNELLAYNTALGQFDATRSITNMARGAEGVVGINASRAFGSVSASFWSVGRDVSTGNRWIGRHIGFSGAPTRQAWFLPSGNSSPQGIAYDNATSTFFVVDGSNERIYQYSRAAIERLPSGTSGATVAAQNFTSLDSQNDDPTAITWVLHGSPIVHRLYVTDRRDFKLYAYGLGSGRPHEPANDIDYSDVGLPTNIPVRGLAAYPPAA